MAITLIIALGAVFVLVLVLVCQGRSKIGPPWRRKTRPSGR